MASARETERNRALVRAGNLRRAVRVRMAELDLTSYDQLTDGQPTRETIENWLSGRSVPQTAGLTNVAAKLKVPVSYLLDAFEGKQKRLPADEGQEASIADALSDLADAIRQERAERSAWEQGLLEGLRDLLGSRTGVEP